ncbi:MAG: MTAP family purine nucleoside phosphorylase [Armatimonadetes bacterium]|nr:MTAP family purine nucleoside phosphorylase [Armatimonadota bacterium]
MAEADVAIIGGTGIGPRLAALGGEARRTAGLEWTLIDVDGLKVGLVQRHSAGHKVPPHRVDYVGMAQALREIGVQGCLASAAVGSLHADWAPETLAVCTDFLDLTCRRLTLFHDTVVHTPFAVPFPLAGALNTACLAVPVKARGECVYVGLDGPRYETPAEIRMLRTFGGDVVGMTASSEAIVMREAGVDYGCLAVVTNLGCGLGESVPHHGEVVDVMQTVGQTVVDVLLAAARLVP